MPHCTVHRALTTFGHCVPWAQGWVRVDMSKAQAPLSLPPCQPWKMCKSQSIPESSGNPHSMAGVWVPWRGPAWGLQGQGSRPPGSGGPALPHLPAGV